MPSATPAVTSAAVITSSEPVAAPDNRRAQRRAFRREEILRTAFELVTEGGLDAVTTTELAKRTGAALGALYRFFPSKAAVIAALQQQALADLTVELREAIAAGRVRQATLPIRIQSLAAIVTVADTFFALPTKHTARFRLIDEIMSNPASVLDDHDARVHEAERVAPLLALVLDEATRFATQQQRPVDDELRRFPFVLWAGLHGVTHFIKRDRLLEPALHSPRIAGSMVRLLLRGLGATTADITDAITAAAPDALQP